VPEKHLHPVDWNTRIPIDPNPAAGEPFLTCWSLELPDTLEYSGQVFMLPGKLEVRAERSSEGRSFWVEITFSSKASSACSRCLKETPLEIGGSFRYFYTPSADDDRQAADDEMTVAYPPDAVEVDLSEQIWESFVVSLPEKVLCRDKCAGLCPVCGADLNLGSCGCQKAAYDPRMQALKDILPDVSED